MKTSAYSTGISKVLITGGHETGGLQSFAETLADGFAELGIPAEVISPGSIYSRWRELRNRKVLKILSTTAVYAAPFSRRTICVAHGLPRADAQGWIKVLALFASFKIASASKGSRLVAVSFYTASHIKAIFNVKVHSVVHNPLSALFFSPNVNAGSRRYVTYVGRLHHIKNIHKLLPSIVSCLNEHPELSACVVGDGALRASMEKQFGNDSRVRFVGNADALAVKTILANTRVFISGCETEGLGISYLEALSQGCSVVMPACGGGLEIAPDLIGSQVHLMPLSFGLDDTKIAIEKALAHYGSPAPLSHFEAASVAKQYLEIGAGVP